MLLFLARPEVSRIEGHGAGCGTKMASSPELMASPPETWSTDCRYKRRSSELYAMKIYFSGKYWVS